jgi:hypothetical protein
MTHPTTPAMINRVQAKHAATPVSRPQKKRVTITSNGDGSQEGRPIAPRLDPSGRRRGSIRLGIARGREVGEVTYHRPHDGVVGGDGLVGPPIADLAGSTIGDLIFFRKDIKI